MTPVSTLEVQGRDHFPKDDVVFTDHFQKDDIWRHRPTDCEKIAILDDVVCEWPLTILGTILIQAVTVISNGFIHK